MSYPARAEGLVNMIISDSSVFCLVHFFICHIVLLCFGLSSIEIQTEFMFTSFIKSVAVLQRHKYSPMNFLWVMLTFFNWPCKLFSHFWIYMYMFLEIKQWLGTLRSLSCVSLMSSIVTRKQTIFFSTLLEPSR